MRKISLFLKVDRKFFKPYNNNSRVSEVNIIELKLFSDSKHKITNGLSDKKGFHVILSVSHTCEKKHTKHIFELKYCFFAAFFISSL